jgi:hypothetical protein
VKRSVPAWFVAISDGSPLLFTVKGEPDTTVKPPLKATLKTVILSSE